MLLVVFYAFVFAITVNESLGCWISSAGLLAGRSAGRLQHSFGAGFRSLSADDIATGHWTFGVCSKYKESCLKKRYNSNNIAEISVIQLARSDLDSFDSALLDSLTFPRVESMNCDELCNCLSCAPGQCEVDKDQCPGNERGFICKCGHSDLYPSINAIVKDMLITGLTCRKCDK